MLIAGILDQALITNWGLDDCRQEVEEWSRVDLIMDWLQIVDRFQDHVDWSMVVRRL